MENVTLENHRQQKISKRIAEIPKKYRKVYEKAATGGNKPAAIKAFCLECVCWQKNEIINCTCVTCPLYLVRPFVKTQKREKNGLTDGANHELLISEAKI